MIWIGTRPKNPKTLPYGASYNAATVGDHRAAVLVSGLRHHLSRPRRRQPVSGFIAVQEGKIAGFACHDATCPNFFGPTGIEPKARKNGIGTALLLACLEDMRQQGFGYAIIGGVGPAAYYAKAVGAVAIEGSEPGIYRGLL
jgi:predicted N-acetyltransferase YhbS